MQGITVQELINILEKIPNKNLNIKIKGNGLYTTDVIGAELKNAKHPYVLLHRQTEEELSVTGKNVVVFRESSIPHTEGSY